MELRPTRAKQIRIKDDGNYYDGTTVEQALQEIVSGGVGLSVRGTFTNASLVAGKLTITHNRGLSAPYSIIIAIFNNSSRQILPDEVTGGANSVEVDLTNYGVLTGTWGYAYI